MPGQRQMSDTWPAPPHPPCGHTPSTGQLAVPMVTPVRGRAAGRSAAPGAPGPETHRRGEGAVPQQSQLYSHVPGSSHFSSEGSQCQLCPPPAPRCHLGGHLGRVRLSKDSFWGKPIDLSTHPSVSTCYMSGTGGCWWGQMVGKQPWARDPASQSILTTLFQKQHLTCTNMASSQ